MRIKCGVAAQRFISLSALVGRQSDKTNVRSRFRQRDEEGGCMRGIRGVALRMIIDLDTQNVLILKQLKRLTVNYIKK